MMKALVIAAAVAVGIGRFFMPAHPTSLPGTYEAFAHLFVGGLIGAALCGRRWLWWPVGILSAVELTAAFLLH